MNKFKSCKKLVLVMMFIIGFTSFTFTNVLAKTDMPFVHGIRMINVDENETKESMHDDEDSRVVNMLFAPVGVPAGAHKSHTNQQVLVSRESSDIFEDILLIAGCFIVSAYTIRELNSDTDL